MIIRLVSAIWWIVSTNHKFHTQIEIPSDANSFLPIVCRNRKSKDSSRFAILHLVQTELCTLFIVMTAVICRNCCAFRFVCMKAHCNLECRRTPITTMYIWKLDIRMCQHLSSRITYTADWITLDDDNDDARPPLPNNQEHMAHGSSQLQNIQYYSLYSEISALFSLCI